MSEREKERAHSEKSLFYHDKNEARGLRCLDAPYVVVEHGGSSSINKQ